jgi:fibronectin type III domain
MKVKKWSVSIATFAVMAVMMVLCAVCAGAEAYGNFEYGVLDDGTVEITGYKGSEQKVDVPEKINKKSVTRIGNLAFKDCTKITSIAMPDSVAYIGRSAFYNCTSLKSITIPDGVKEIGYAAFSECAGLVSVKIPDNVTKIGDSAFINCANLTKIDVTAGNKYYSSANGVLFNKDKSELICYPAGIKNVGYSIPDGVTVIRDRAFNKCLSLNSITIPKSVQDIETYSFFGCTSLEAINVAASNKNYADVNGILFSKDKTKIVCYPANKKNMSYSIPVSVKVVGVAAFRDCIYLKGITIPDSVTNIEHHAFSNCKSLKSITIPDSITAIEMATFIDCASLTGVKIPDSVTSIRSGAFSNCTSLTKITIPSGVKTIADSALGYCYDDNGNKKTTGLKIYCYSNTQAEAYAKSGKFSYVLLDKLPAFAKVTGFKVKSKTNVSANLQWNKNISADGYVLDKYDGSKWVTIKTFTSNANTSFNVTGLKASTTFKFRIKAYKMYDITTVYSAFTYLNVNTRPYTTTGMKCSSKTNVSANLRWNKNISANGYVLDKYDGKKWVTIKTFTSNTNTSFNVTGLKASTTFKFRLRAYKNFGSVKEYSAFTYLNVNTRPYTTTGMKCSSKTNVSANLQWNKNRSADGYVLDKYDGKKWVTIKTFTSNANTSFNVTGLKASTTFKFRLRAYKNFGSAKEYSAFTYLNVNTRPYTTTGFKMKSATKNAITLQWNKNISASGYCIEKWNGSKWVQIKRYTSNANVTYTATGLKANTAYKFRIRAYKTIGNVNEYSAYSAVVTARTQK